MSYITFCQRGLTGLCLLGLIAACAPQQPTANQYRKNIRAWVGRPTDELIAQWGQPTQVFMKDKMQYLIYVVDKNVALPGTESTLHQGDLRYLSPLADTPAYTVHIFCQTTFTAKDGMISDYMFEGNGCRAR